MKLQLFAATAALLLFANYAKASYVPYAHAGTPITTDTDLVATSSTVDAYFYGSNADDRDYIEIYDVTTGKYLTTVPGGSQTFNIQFFDNDATFVGTEQNLYGATAGNVLQLDVFNSDLSRFGELFTSNPSNNPEEPGDSNAYVTAYSHSSSYPYSGIPAGVFVGMEDLGPNVDWDYNDDEYVLTGVALTATPEPSSLILLGSGLLAAAGALRRRQRSIV